jgi:two-component system, response regulator RegA
VKGTAGRVGAQGKLLLVDDEVTFCRVLADAMEKRGFTVITAYDYDAAQRAARAICPDFAVVDLRIGEQSGLKLVPELKRINPEMRLLVLTGFASVATAVEAVKLGATHYLAKPVDADEIVAALHRDEGNPEIPVTTGSMSMDRVEWEHIQKVLADHDGNISAAARALKMHRRTLQRKLAKYPARE